jgi:uncharacterized protein YpuA (DUF1002 family)
METLDESFEKHYKKHVKQTLENFNLYLYENELRQMERQIEKSKMSIDYKKLEHQKLIDKYQQIINQRYLEQIESLK